MAQLGELEHNAFYKALQDKYFKKFEQAQQKSWVICIPQQTCLSGVCITSDLIDYHILKPSPFFKGHYLATVGKDLDSFEVEEDLIITPNGCKVRILMEETGYNEEYKPFKIFVIDKLLNSDNKGQAESSQCTDAAFGESYTFNPSHYLTLLHSNPEFMKILDKRINQYCSSYMVLPDYLHDASWKLRTIIDWAHSALFLPSSATREQNQFERLLAVEYYILNNVHSKIFPVIKESFSIEDNDLTQKIFSLKEAGLSPDQLGVKETFCCPTPSAIVELASLNQKITPVEKLICLVTTLELLNQDIDSYLQETYSPLNTNAEIPHLSSDDLLPLLVSVIIKSRPMYLSSNLFYVQNFSWYLSTKDKYSFTLVTFQAAKEFIRSNSFNIQKPAASKIKKEMTLEELMQMSLGLQDNQKAGSSSGTEPKVQQSTFDHQLEHVTKMIEASTIDLRQERYKKDAT